jgi:hypothetical protein
MQRFQSIAAAVSRIAPGELSVSSPARSAPCALIAL